MILELIVTVTDRVLNQTSQIRSAIKGGATRGARVIFRERELTRRRPPIRLADPKVSIKKYAFGGEDSGHVKLRW